MIRLAFAFALGFALGFVLGLYMLEWFVRSWDQDEHNHHLPGEPL